VHLSRQAAALIENGFEAQAQGADARVVDGQNQQRRRQQATRQEPPGAVKIGPLLQPDGCFGDRGWIAYFKSGDAESILPRGKVGITGDPVGSGIDPVAVKVLQPVAEADVLLRAQQ
jgi:hypothetical protein